MPNDTKLGLIVGLGVVVTAAVLFFQKEAPAGGPQTSVTANAPLVARPATPSAAAMLPSPAPLPRPGDDRDAPGHITSRRPQ